MKLTPNSFFDGDFKEINLNDFFSKKGLCDSNRPELFQRALNELGYNTYGGYGENRKDIFKNSYLAKTKKFYHLGVDINATVGTPIKCPFDCFVLDRFIDKDEDIGWGGRLILRSRKFILANGVYFYPFLVLGHLNPKTMTSNKSLLKGQILGFVGSWPTNGKTFQHLHVQCINTVYFKNLDGYGIKRDLKDNPNPFEVEF